MSRMGNPLYKSRDKSGGLANVRMSSAMFLPLRGHGAKSIDDDTTRVGSGAFFPVKSHSCSHTSATTWRWISLDRKWPCIPQYVQCQGQLFRCL